MDGPYGNSHDTYGAAGFWSGKYYSAHPRVRENDEERICRRFSYRCRGRGVCFSLCDPCDGGTFGFGCGSWKECMVGNPADGAVCFGAQRSAPFDRDWIRLYGKGDRQSFLCGCGKMAAADFGTCDFGSGIFAVVWRLIKELAQIELNIQILHGNVA